MKDLLREMFFGFIAIAMLIELIGGDLFCLWFAIDRVIALLGVSELLAYRHMMALAFWNFIAALGAGLVFYTLRRTESYSTRRVGIILTTIGLLGYAVYQFWFASNYLNNNVILVQSAAVIYALFGVGAWRLGQAVLAESWQPEQPIQRNPADTFRTKLAD